MWRLALLEGSFGGDLKEGDVWHQLEKELQAPLEAPSAPQEAKDDYDEEWGITWRGRRVFHRRVLNGFKNFLRSFKDLVKIL